MADFKDARAKLIVNGQDISHEVKTFQLLLYESGTEKILLDVNVHQVRKPQQVPDDSISSGELCTNCGNHSNSVVYLPDEVLCNECLAEPSVIAQSDRDFLKRMRIKWE